MDRADFIADLVTKEDAPVFEGSASVDCEDLAGDRIVAGAFGSPDARRVPLLFAHNSAEPLGGWREIRQEGKRLRVVGELNMDVARSREVYSLLRRKQLSGLSVGFIVDPKHVDYDSRAMKRTIKKAELLEISIVAVPCNRQARIDGVKSHLAEALRGAGLRPETRTTW